MVVALSVFALPAHAAKVGLLGGDFDPPPINDGIAYPFGTCGQLTDFFGGTSYFDNYACLFYDFADIDGIGGDDAVSSIEILLTGGALSGVFDYELLGDIFDEFDFDELDTADGGVLFESALRLSTDGSGISPFVEGCEFECPELELALFLGPDEFDDSEDFDGLAGRVVAVNGTITVPEPSSLLLFGPGALAAFLSRRRVRSVKHA